MDKDGVPDIVVADPGWGAEGTRLEIGFVWIVSGRTHKPLPTVHSENRGDGFGSSALGGLDLDKDGCPDWIVGCPAAGPDVHACVIAYSGQTGRELYRIKSPNTGDRFGSTLAMIRDLDGDGCDDIIVGAIDNSRGLVASSGVAHVLSGRTGAEIRALHSDSAENNEAYSVSSVADVDSDGYDEVLVALCSDDKSLYGADHVAIFSGRDGSLLRTTNALDHERICCVSRGCAGDNSHYLLGYRGGVTLIDGRSGRWSGRIAGEPLDLFGWAATSLEDVNGDGVLDYLVAAPRWGMWGGRVCVYSGSDHRLLYAVDREIAEVHHLGHSLSVLGDIDGDGVTDFILGSDHRPSGGVGRAEVYSGKRGKLLFELRRDGDEVRPSW